MAACATSAGCTLTPEMEDAYRFLDELNDKWHPMTDAEFAKKQGEDAFRSAKALGWSDREALAWQELWGAPPAPTEEFFRP